MDLKIKASTTNPGMISADPINTRKVHDWTVSAKMYRFYIIDTTQVTFIKSRGMDNEIDDYMVVKGGLGGIILDNLNSQFSGIGI